MNPRYNSPTCQKIGKPKNLHLLMWYFFIETKTYEERCIFLVQKTRFKHGLIWTGRFRYSKKMESQIQQTTFLHSNIEPLLDKLLFFDIRFFPRSSPDVVHEVKKKHTFGFFFPVGENIHLILSRCEVPYVYDTRLKKFLNNCKEAFWRHRRRRRVFYVRHSRKRSSARASDKIFKWSSLYV